jgi:enoyl-CoA hydratase
MILTGEMISADEAYRIGLVNHVHPDETLLDASRALMGRIIANAPIALGFAIETVTRGMEMPLEEGLALETHLFSLLGQTSDMREGVTAFLEKRKPSFEGR